MLLLELERANRFNSELSRANSVLTDRYAALSDKHTHVSLRLIAADTKPQPVLPLLQVTEKTEQSVDHVKAAAEAASRKPLSEPPSQQAETNQPRVKKMTKAATEREEKYYHTMALADLVRLRQERASRLMSVLKTHASLEKPHPSTTIHVTSRITTQEVSEGGGIIPNNPNNFEDHEAMVTMDITGDDNDEVPVACEPRDLCDHDAAANRISSDLSPLRDDTSICTPTSTESGLISKKLKSSSPAHTRYRDEAYLGDLTTAQLTSPHSPSQFASPLDARRTTVSSSSSRGASPSTADFSPPVLDAHSISALSQYYSKSPVSQKVQESPRRGRVLERSVLTEDPNFNSEFEDDSTSGDRAKLKNTNENVNTGFSMAFNLASKHIESFKNHGFTSPTTDSESPGRKRAERADSSRGHAHRARSTKEFIVASV